MAFRQATFHENYAQDMAVFRTASAWAALVAFLLFLAVCPFFLSDRILTIMTMIGIAIISVHGLNILTGYCGQISMGHVGFMAVSLTFDHRIIDGADGARFLKTLKSHIETPYLLLVGKRS